MKWRSKENLDDLFSLKGLIHIKVKFRIGLFKVI